ncbi:hypothetical protein BpHYR1_046316 [Brachionus plicatilis]|uniref:Uncharacterized protein n=1 Tax=Brachionus plicatilis TaxID=10195 RepID=A0A3M7SFV0_BRAPC|nr:hypothetical protein BpHYR1_046316 [Brachionus plicatilis]
MNLIDFEIKNCQYKTGTDCLLKESKLVQRTILRKWLTKSIRRDNQYLMSHSDSYYINLHMDFHLLQS